MNTVTRILNASATAAMKAPARSSTKSKFLMFSQQSLLVSTLVITIFISAVGVIYDQAMNRILFSQLQSLEKSRDNLSMEWGQLLLEQSTWATQARVQDIAQNDLSMYFPNQKNVVVVNE